MGLGRELTAAVRVALVAAALAGAAGGHDAAAQARAVADPDYRAGGIVLKAPASAAAGPAAPAPPPVASLALVELQLTTQVAFGRPVDNVTTFTPDRPAIFAWFRYAGAPPGSALSARVVFLAPAGEIEAFNLTAPLVKADDVGSLKFSAPSDGWPAGAYRLDVSAGGRTLRSLPFQVRR